MMTVHIFSIRFDKDKSIKYLESLTMTDNQLKAFADRMEDAYDYFEKYKQMRVVLISENGDYIINDAPPRKGKK
ncbi:MAG: hypothetical protein IPI78_18080 [Chitinophagaceae bacterium]|nr:hypothetical protein [Chitinophagaceae bacterium]